MKKYYFKIASLGALLWLTVFITSLLMYSIKKNNQVLFDTLIAVALTFFTSLFSTIFFNKIKTDFLISGTTAGITWMLINIAFDSLFFFWGPMKMSTAGYIEDIGLTYCIIPIITISIGIILKLKTNDLLDK